MKNARRLPLCLFLLAAAWRPGRAQEDLSSAFQALGKLHFAKSEAKPDYVQIVIYHTNDIHGAIEAVKANPEAHIPASGGAASLATLLKRETRPHIWIDSGDWFQGKPIGDFTKGDALIAVFNALHPAAAVIGNHEYDTGEENVERLAGEARFPILGSNIHSQAFGTTIGYVKKTLIVRLGGVKIGVVGLLTDDMANLASKKNTDGLDFVDPAAEAAADIRDLRRQGATVIVAATHLGIEKYGERVYDSIPHGDLYLAKSSPDIDVILGGHTHTAISQRVMVEKLGHATLITQTGGYLSAVDQVVLTVDRRSGAVVDSRSQLIALDPEKYPADPEIAGLIERYAGPIRKEMEAPIGSAEFALTKTTPGQSVLAETTLGDWYADTLRRYGGTDLGMVNTLGIRGNGLPAGTLTLGHLFELAPFPNQVVKLSIHGSELRKLVEQNVRKDLVWLQYSGLSFSFDPDADGAKVRDLKVGDQPIDDARVYTVTTMDFTATVDAAFKGIDKTITEKQETLARDVLIEEVRKHSPISVRLDGRVKAVKAASAAN